MIYRLTSSGSTWGLGELPQTKMTLPAFLTQHICIPVKSHPIVNYDACILKTIWTSCLLIMMSEIKTHGFFKANCKKVNRAHIHWLRFVRSASSTYQTEGAIFSPQQVGQEAQQGGLIPPAPAGCVEVGGDGEVGVWQKASEETHSQGHKTTPRQLLPRWKNNFFQPTACSVILCLYRWVLRLTGTLNYFEVCCELVEASQMSLRKPKWFPDPSLVDKEKLHLK